MLSQWLLGGQHGLSDSVADDPMYETTVLEAYFVFGRVDVDVDAFGPQIDHDDAGRVAAFEHE